MRRQPVRPTDLGLLVIRLRLSLREDKKEFGARLHVHRKTITEWEFGHTLGCLPVYQAMLDTLYIKLRDAKLLVPEATAVLEMQKIIERHGDRDDMKSYLTKHPIDDKVGKVGSDITPVNQLLDDDKAPLTLEPQ